MGFSIIGRAHQIPENSNQRRDAPMFMSHILATWEWVRMMGYDPHHPEIPFSIAFSLVVRAGEIQVNS